MAHTPSLLAPLPYVRQSNLKSERSAGKRCQTTYIEASESRTGLEGGISSVDTHSLIQPIFFGAPPVREALLKALVPTSREPGIFSFSVQFS